VIEVMPADDKAVLQDAIDQQLLSQTTEEFEHCFTLELDSATLG
jgi:hypothetical protein